MEPNPFAALSLIAAPAVLTNASSLLVLSTSTRLARAVDRARTLSTEMESATHADSAALRELAGTEVRALLLLRALRWFYVALGGFASSAFVSLVGAVFAPGAGPLERPLQVAALAIGALAVGGLVMGTLLVVRETRIVVDSLRDRADAARARLR